MRNTFVFELHPSTSAMDGRINNGNEGLSGTLFAYLSTAFQCQSDNNGHKFIGSVECSLVRWLIYRRFVVNIRGFHSLILSCDLGWRSSRTILKTWNVDFPFKDFNIFSAMHAWMTTKTNHYWPVPIHRWYFEVWNTKLQHLEWRSCWQYLVLKLTSKLFFKSMIII